ncbi:hypothetical protein DASC09_006020 [Saccharomycopsis crataegensis]|uniref:Aminotransferase n=1 Tax=Saccharomycopsis crataegensis TaxID=43959 RepID=A0AAV5QF50_9ASCO|nr:hypothetical protein DASC09_006020 [Saccharomycopsis crataegensis]
MVTKVFHRKLTSQPPLAVKAEGPYIYLEDGSKILDAVGGAAVTSVGHSNKEIIDAITQQLNTLQYAHSSAYTSDSAEKLAEIILEHPRYAELGFDKACFYNSGSEANETALKLARQYTVERGQPQRINIISRDRSYHGNSFGAMSLSGHKIRMRDYKAMFDERRFHKVSTPFSFHLKEKDETEEQYCARLIKELDDKFQEIGPDTVLAFFAETMSGSTCGCALPPLGYFEGVKAVCEKYGALLVTDEVMCGSGRLGSFFAWEQLADEADWHKLSPHISTFGKSIGSGYLPLSGLVVHKDIADCLEKGSGNFMSRQTYQAHPTACAAGYAVQKYVKTNNLYDNIQKMAKRLEQGLQESIGGMESVADIRGKGMFWAVEFMKDKENGIPYDPSLNFVDVLTENAWKNGLGIMPCHGTIDGEAGEHIILAPNFNVDAQTIDEIVSLLKKSLIETEAEFK